MATVKQKKAIDNLVAFGGNVTKAMLEADYSSNTAHTPQKLTESKAFKEWLEEAELTDEELANLIKEGAHATKTIVMGKKEDSFVDIQPDHLVRHKFIETSLKLKGHLNDVAPANTTINQILVKFVNAKDD